ncbi:MAG: UDP-N-acetylmuramoyl-L-alanine--D-glutamate ligase [Candidatus Dasytiphilus stammeri]
MLIIGIGITGISCIDFFLSRDISPRVIDTRSNPPELNKYQNKVEYCGFLNRKLLQSTDMIVLSPGISIMHPFVQEALANGIEIVSDIELFCREARFPIVAITGTNGKTTVSTLITDIARSYGYYTGLGGNSGLPALKLLLQPYELYVLEISSFQLETIQSIQSVAATILNISEDHLDRYPLGFNHYRDTKLRIYEQSDVCIYNAEDKNTHPKRSSLQKYVSFGRSKGNYYLDRSSSGSVWLYVNGNKLLNTKNIRLLGDHNYMNVLAALAVADVLGVPRNVSLKTISNFTGLPHRYQLIWENNRIQWINDSKATNVGSTIAALKLTRKIRSGIIHLLLGGDGKSADFSPLKEYLQDRIQVYCFGRDKDLLATLYPEITIKTNTMIAAMHLLAKKLKPGDTVLLSPACSSQDQYSNFSQRGNIFTSLAQKLG